MIVNESTTRTLLFTGKGGVGKTSVACATAIALADTGKRVLLVSTDPASNLSDVLGTSIGSSPVPVNGVPGLVAVNIDPAAAAAAYRNRVVDPYRGKADEAEISRIEEQLSGACTVEIAAFDAFAGMLAGGSPEYDHVVFDTAPTGHTLRLLALPTAWSTFLETNTSGASCLGPHSGLTVQKGLYADAVSALGDSRRTTLVLVARPDTGSLSEAARSSSELAALGLRNQMLVINAVFNARDVGDPIATALEARGTRAMSSMPACLVTLPRVEIPLRGHNILGCDALRSFLSGNEAIDVLSAAAESIPELPSLKSLVDEIGASGHGLVLVTGKGGVGKTTIAAAIAVELSARGLPVHLTTTDPASHLTGTLGQEVPGLRVSRIDPKAETDAYIARALEVARPHSDALALETLAEDLRSPCTEEVAVFHAFSRLITSARREIVIMDTAPTGHTLLLLDATGAYHREMVRKLGNRTIGTPMLRLRDPEHTRVLIVTLPETTPVHEAAELQADLRRAGIEPFAWIVNASLAAARPTDPLLAARARAELEQIRAVEVTHAVRMAVVPWFTGELTGSDSLRHLAVGSHST
ncbi:MAG: arsenical pump-driving ATPase [Blastocatellia bacterium]|nr:arsenical pump-driving ATPase [Blastocatellia bacterium]